MTRTCVSPACARVAVADSLWCRACLTERWMLRDREPAWLARARERGGQLAKELAR